MRRRLIPLLSLVLLTLVVVLGAGALAPTPAQAQGGRMRQVGGYGVVTKNASTYAFGSLDSQVNGSAQSGELVYINGWQIGVYHIGDNRWIAASAVQPIIDYAGSSMANSVTFQGGTWYMNGRALALPRRRATFAERYLANPTVNAPVIFQGSSVPLDTPTEIVDSTQVWLSPRAPVVATMRVTKAYDFIYLRTGPSEASPKAAYNAYAGEVLTAYEMVGNWYRIDANVWAPRVWGNDVLLETENVAAYAPAEYFNGGKWISVDLGRQRMTAWEGNDVVISSPIKTGKYGYATPTGTFKTYSKIPNERMSGSDYDLLDVAWTQYFSGAVALHTAYWHNNYNGRPGSHGCVNMPEEKARMLFMWSPVGTTVVSHNPYKYDAIDIRNASQWSEYER